MNKLLFIFLGGGLGSVLRYVLSKYLNNFEAIIPFGTFIVNVLGSLLIGIVLGLTIKNSLINQHLTLFFAVGFCGGFTTFSTFAFENSVFIKNGDYINFAVYTIASIVTGIIAVFLGLFLVK